VTASGFPSSYGTAMPTAFPDPRNAGTRGHMLDQVREAWCDPYAHTMASGGGSTGVALRWSCWVGLADFGGSTEHEALLAAREAAP